jgi:polyhydroxybutyrate depolymerase
MRAIILLLFIFPVLTIKGQTSVKSFTFDGIVRSYRIFIPSGYDPAIKHPVVFNLHGNGSNASVQESYSEMNLVADTANFIIIYPDGLNNTWNVGFNNPYNSGTKDVGFISALIDTVSANYNVDPLRVYSCGMSLGGFMSYRLACELHERIAAIASVTGLMSSSLPNNCQQDKAVPVLQIHGTDDETVLYNGTNWHTSVNYTMDYWIQKNSCPTSPIITNIPDIVNEGSTVVKYYYGPCTNNSEVVLFKVENGGHTWPGDIPYAPLGNTNQDIKASIEIWKFFSRHKLNSTTEVVSLDEKQKSKVFPNPFNDKLNITFMESTKPRILSVYNYIGEQVYTESIAPSNKSMTVDLSAQIPGLYFMVISGENSKEILKVLKN